MAARQDKREAAEAAAAARHDRAPPPAALPYGARERLLAGGLGSLAACRRGAAGACRRLRAARGIAARRAALDDLAASVAALKGVEEALREAILWPAA